MIRFQFNSEFSPHERNKMKYLLLIICILILGCETNESILATKGYTKINIDIEKGERIYKDSLGNVWIIRNRDLTRAQLISQDCNDICDNLIEKKDAIYKGENDNELLNEIQNIKEKLKNIEEQETEDDY
jgi:hypothetical protein